MHVMNDQLKPFAVNIPTPEQSAARQLRLLRQARGWSQQDVAEKLRAYGHDWSQATVTRLESASRPIRLNELSDLAALYGVEITQFLETEVPEDQEALAREIENLVKERVRLQRQREVADLAYEEAMLNHQMVIAHVINVEGRLRTLLRWQADPGEGGRAEVEKRLQALLRRPADSGEDGKQ
jgi:transcriptional regulator with XRE-family HTH domain